MEPLKFGIVRKEGWSILFNHIPIKLNSVDKEITLYPVDLIKSSIYGKLDSSIA